MELEYARCLCFYRTVPCCAPTQPCCAPTEFIERMELKYGAAAAASGAHVASAAGYDSLPADLGTVYTQVRAGLGAWLGAGQGAGLGALLAAGTAVASL